MKKSDNQSKPKRIYDNETHQWFEVPEEEYASFDRWRTALRKRMQAHKRCMCPRSRWWLCDGMCEDCEYCAAGDILSLDATTTNADGDEVSLMDSTEDRKTRLDEVILDQILMNQLIARLTELMPEAPEIGKLRLQGLKDEAIADIIGVKRTTFRSRIAKAEATLREEFGEDYPF